MLGRRFIPELLSPVTRYAFSGDLLISASDGLIDGGTTSTSCKSADRIIFLLDY